MSDIVIIMTNKGEKAPHSYCTIERNLNKGTMVRINLTFLLNIFINEFYKPLLILLLFIFNKFCNDYH